MLWGYPRTIWWLKDKGYGDELEVLIEAKSDRPEVFKTLVKTALASVGKHPSADIMSAGSAPYARFYVTGSSFSMFDSVVREALTRLFREEAEASVADSAPADRADCSSKT